MLSEEFQNQIKAEIRSNAEEILLETLEKIVSKQIKILFEDSFKENINIFVEESKKEWLNIKDSCDYMGVSYNTLQKFNNMGLKKTMVGDLVRYSKKDLDEFYNKYASKS